MNEKILKSLVESQELVDVVFTFSKRLQAFQRQALFLKEKGLLPVRTEHRLMRSHRAKPTSLRLMLFRLNWQSVTMQPPLTKYTLLDARNHDQGCH